MPLLAARPGAQRRRLRGRRLRRRRAGARDAWTTSRALADDLRAAGMALCIDVVLNHVAAEHPWARRPGLPAARSPTASEPDAYERTLPEVFPDIAPGSFTWSDEHRALGLDDVQHLPVGPRLHEPRRVRGDGRGDARPRRGRRRRPAPRRRAVPVEAARHRTARTSPRSTSCCGAFRAALRIAAPARGVEGRGDRGPARPRALPRTGKHEGKECDLAYHNVLMVLLWSALASGRVALMTATLKAMPPVPQGAGWLTYVRCHDDIGWSITPEDAARVGEDDHLHRRFLADFYAGEFPGTFARGARFQPDPRTGEARTSRHLRLAGRARERAGRPVAVDLAVRRVLLLYAIAFAHGGLPLIYMGDELGLLNDAVVPRRPGRPTTTAGCTGRRWTGRRPRAAHDPATVEGRLWAGLRRLIAARRATRAIHVQGVSEPIWTGNEHVFGLCREQAGERLLVLANFTADAAAGRARRGARPRLPADRGGRRGRRPPDRGLPRLHRAGALPAPVAARLSAATVVPVARGDRIPRRIHEPPTQTTFGCARYAGALAASMPPVGQKRICGNGPGERLQRLDAADASAGKSFACVIPRSSSATMSDAVAVPGRNGTPLACSASSSVGVAPGETRKRAPARERVGDLARAVVTVPGADDGARHLGRDPLDRRRRRGACAASPRSPAGRRARARRRAARRRRRRRSRRPGSPARARRGPRRSASCVARSSADRAANTDAPCVRRGPTRSRKAANSSRPVPVGARGLGSAGSRSPRSTSTSSRPLLGVHAHDVAVAQARQRAAARPPPACSGSPPGPCPTRRTCARR